MPRPLCRECGEPHDIEELEPSLRRADPVIDALRAGEHGRIHDARDCAALLSDDGDPERCFLRVLLPFAVRGRSAPVHWGVWVEVSKAHFSRTMDLWDSPQQDEEPPFEAFLANDLPDYSSTIGLPGLVQLTGPSSIPVLTLTRESDHPLAVAHRSGVTEQDVLDWLLPVLHPATPRSGGTAVEDLEEEPT